MSLLTLPPELRAHIYSFLILPTILPAPFPSPNNTFENPEPRETVASKVQKYVPSCRSAGFGLLATNHVLRDEFIEFVRMERRRPGGEEVWKLDLQHVSGYGLVKTWVEIPGLIENPVEGEHTGLPASTASDLQSDNSPKGSWDRRYKVSTTRILHVTLDAGPRQIRFVGGDGGVSHFVHWLFHLLSNILSYGHTMGELSVYDPYSNTKTLSATAAALDSYQDSSSTITRSENSPPQQTILASPPQTKNKTPPAYKRPFPFHTINLTIVRHSNLDTSWPAGYTEKTPHTIWQTVTSILRTGALNGIVQYINYDDGYVKRPENIEQESLRWHEAGYVHDVMHFDGEDGYSYKASDDSLIARWAEYEYIWLPVFKKEGGGERSQ